MRAQPELVAALLQLVLALPAERKLLILTTKKMVILTMQLQPLKVLLLRPKLQQPHLLKVLHRLQKALLPPRKLQRLKVLHQQPRLLLPKHQPLKALLRLQKRSSWRSGAFDNALRLMTTDRNKGRSSGNAHFHGIHFPKTIVRHVSLFTNFGWPLFRRISACGVDGEPWSGGFQSSGWPRPDSGRIFQY
jgi:hypothetical protein